MIDLGSADGSGPSINSESGFLGANGCHEYRRDPILRGRPLDDCDVVGDCLFTQSPLLRVLSEAEDEF